jgi:hypothetical protein
LSPHRWKRLLQTESRQNIQPTIEPTTVLLNYFQRWETTVYQAFSGNSGFFDLNSIWQKAAPEDQRPAPPQNGG